MRVNFDEEKEPSPQTQQKRVGHRSSAGGGRAGGGRDATRYGRSRVCPGPPVEFARQRLLRWLRVVLAAETAAACVAHDVRGRCRKWTTPSGEPRRAGLLVPRRLVTAVPVSHGRDGLGKRAEAAEIERQSASSPGRRAVELDPTREGRGLGSCSAAGESLGELTGAIAADMFADGGIRRICRSRRLTWGGSGGETDPPITNCLRRSGSRWSVAPRNRLGAWRWSARHVWAGGFLGRGSWTFSRTASSLADRVRLPESLGDVDEAGVQGPSPGGSAIRIMRGFAEP